MKKPNRTKVPNDSSSPDGWVRCALSIPSAGSCFSLLAADSYTVTSKAVVGKWLQTGWDSCPSVLA